MGLFGRKKPAPDPRLDVLRSMALFSALADDDLRDVLRIGRDVRHGSGDDVVREGGMGLGFHVIVEGAARVEAGGAQIAEIGAGDFFGEMALIHGTPRTATVTAATPLRTLSFAGPHLIGLIERYPSVGDTIERVMTSRIRPQS